MAHRRTREQWRDLVEGWPRSGLTQREYCNRQGISVASLGRWREIMRRQRRGEPPDGTEVLQLLPVQWVGEGGGAGSLTLVLPDGLRIEVGCGFDGPTLTRLLGL